MKLLRVVGANHPHGRAEPVPVQSLHDVALIRSSNLHWRRGTPYEAQIALDLTGWLWTGLIERISQD